MRARKLAALGAAILGTAAIAPVGAGAATIPVTTTTDTFADDGLCSVREAVQTANSNVAVNASGGADCTVGSQHPTEDTIQLAASAYTLALGGSGNDNNLTGDLDVRVDNGGTAGGPVTIAGQGSGLTEIDAGGLDRVLHLIAGPGTLTLQGLRLDNGTAPAGESGGALFNNQANATSAQLSDVRVSNSTSPVSGGGIYWPSAGALSITNGSRVDGNSVSFNGIGNLGGGILLGTNSTLNLTDSTVTGNTATDTSAGVGSTVSGGGITAANSTLNVTRSTISNNALAVPNNAIDFPDGGGVFAQNSAVSIVDSTISGNSVTGGNIRGGGGLYYLDSSDTVDAVKLLVQNSTFSGNSVTSGASSTGGAIRINGGNTTITSSTFSGNTAAVGGADAVYATAAGQSNESLQLRSSIFNEGTNGCAYPNPAGMGVSTGYNLETDDTCWTPNATGDQQNTSVSLGALAFNGGSTSTHELQSGSNGIDDVPNADCDEADGDPLAADQRGVPRPQGSACDVGAYERAGTCLGQVATAVGTGSGETIDGTANSDVIIAGGGADTVNAGDGADRVCGGDGNDVIRGGAGNDSDQLAGEGDTNTLSFGDLSTAATANLNALTTSGTEAGSDTITGFQNLEGGSANDTLTGDANANTIDGAAGDDTIQGLGGPDVLGGGANNAVNLPAFEGDRLSYLSSSNAITANLTAGSATGEGSDTLSGFEALVGGTESDVLTGDSGPNFISGFTGATNVLDGRDGADRFQGTNSPTIDTVTYANGSGPVTANLTTGVVSGAQGADALTGGNIDNLIGSPGDDTLTGDGSANTLSGGDGFDALVDGSSVNAALQADTFNGGPASDTVSYAAKGAGEAVTVNLNNTTGQGEAGGAENDTIAADVESVTGGSDADSITGDEGHNLLTGGPGIDTARFDGLAQAVSASLTGTSNGQGTDGLVGFENVVGSSQNDTLSGDTGANVLNGGGGTDAVSYGYSAFGAEIELGVDAGTAGGGDNDTLTSVENAIGSAGSDIFIDGPVENNSYDGAGGSDFVNYQAATGAMTVNLATGTATGAGSDQLAAIENVEGGPQGDTITGDGAVNDLRGLGGADTITGGLGADDVFGGLGGDQLMVRDGVGDDADCGPGDGAADTVEADAPSGTDTIANCGAEDTINLGTLPADPIPGPTQTQTQTAQRKCPAGSKLKKVKTKSGKVKRKCVRKKKRKR